MQVTETLNEGLKRKLSVVIPKSDLTTRLDKESRGSRKSAGRGDRDRDRLARIKTARSNANNYSTLDISRQSYGRHLLAPEKRDLGAPRRKGLRRPGRPARSRLFHLRIRWTSSREVVRAYAKKTSVVSPKIGRRTTPATAM